MVSKVRGIVIKEMPAGETGKRIVVLTREHGKMLLSARGAKNAKSGILAATQLFSYCEFMLYEGKGFFSITQADVIESFFEIRNDIDRLAYGSYILELTDRVSFEELENNSAFELLFRALFVLAQGKQNPRLTAIIYIIRLLKECGLMGGAYCSECGRHLEDTAYYGPLADGLVCGKCSETASYRIGCGALRALGHMSESGMKELFGFRVSDEVLAQLWRFADVNRRKYFGEHFKSLEYLENA